MFIQKKTVERYFPATFPFILYTVVLIFNSVDQIQKCDHSKDSYLPVVLFIMWYKVVLAFEPVDEILLCDN